jgi:hypothetical protein
VDFVDKILIADYKTLQSSNNPFRYRSKIIDALYALNYADETKEQLRRVYVDQIQITMPEAIKKVDHDIHYILEQFGKIDNRLRQVDKFRAQLENRVAETVRYVDKTLPGIKHRLAGVLSAMGEKITSAPDWYENSEVAQCKLQFTQMMSPASAWRPSKQRTAIEPEVFHEKKISQQAQQVISEMRLYQQRRKIDPLKIGEYIEKHMGERTTIDAADFTITSVEDYVAFCHIPWLRYLKGGASVAARYTITTSDEQVKNEMVITRDFSIKRKG